MSPKHFTDYVKTLFYISALRLSVIYTHIFVTFAFLNLQNIQICNFFNSYLESSVIFVSEDTNSML